MYAKIFASLYQGTLRGRANEILVFTNLIAHADRDGDVDKHPRAIADEVGLPLPAVEEALLNLEAPDPESRSPGHEGRRIIRLDDHRAWGWNIVNHCKYRGIRNEEDRREQNKLAQQKWRDKQNKPRKPRSAHTPASACASEFALEGECKGETKNPERIYNTYPRKAARPAALKAIKVAIEDHGFDFVAGKTLAYADAVAKWPDDAKQYVPYPATWFNQERFNDDPSTWERASGAVMSSTATVIALQRNLSDLKEQEKQLMADTSELWQQKRFPEKVKELEELRVAITETRGKINERGV